MLTFTSLTPALISIAELNTTERVAGTMSGKGYLVVGEKVKEKCNRCYAELSAAAMIYCLSQYDHSS